MEDIRKKFEQLKALLVQRASPVLGDALMKTFLSALEEYQRSLVSALEQEAQRMASLKEENNILRGIAGVSEAEIRAKLIEQGEELRFLREQLIGSKKKLEGSVQQNGELRLSLEQSKAELLQSHRLRENEQKKFQESLASLTREMEKLSLAVREKQQKLDFAREQDRQQAVIEREQAEVDIRREVDNELRSVVNRLRTLCGTIVGTSQFCIERWGRIRADASAGQSKLPKEDISLLSESLPDLDLIFNSSQEIVKIMDSYLQMLDLTTPNFTALNWLLFWQELRKKFSEGRSRNRVRITWPIQKEYPLFVSDQRMLAEVFAALIQTALDAMKEGGTLDITGQFALDRTVIRFADTAPLIKPEARDKIFVPFADVNFGHRGLDLHKAWRLTVKLGGTITCEPGKTGNIFTVDIPCQKENLNGAVLLS